MRRNQNIPTDSKYRLKTQISNIETDSKHFYTRNRMVSSTINDKFDER